MSTWMTLGVGSELVAGTGDPVVETGTERDQKIGLLHSHDRGVIAVHAGHAQVQLMVVGKTATIHQRGDDGDVRHLGERAQLVGGA